MNRSVEITGSGGLTVATAAQVLKDFQAMPSVPDAAEVSFSIEEVPQEASGGEEVAWRGVTFPARITRWTWSARAEWRE